MNDPIDIDPTDLPPPDDSSGTPAGGEAAPSADDATDDRDTAADARPVEIGGQKGPEPTRYGDWERKGRCTDF